MSNGTFVFARKHWPEISTKTVDPEFIYITSSSSSFICSINTWVTRMWANAQRDGRPAEHPASCVQHVSDLHSRFALRPHHAWKYGRHPISDRWN